MNYLHSYHAGHSADVFKHIVLIELLTALKKKDKPFCYIETHAGFAFYDLFAKDAQSTHAYQDGIAKIWEFRETLEPFQVYFDVVKMLNPDRLVFYPGSAYIAHTQLRKPDKLMACDLNPDACQHLKTHLKPGLILCGDGYQQLKAWLPPSIKRGLVFIDPPFEAKDEFDQLPEILAQAYKRWPTGIFCVWYPIKDYKVIERFYTGIKNCAFPEVLVNEFCTMPCDVTPRLNGSGMLIINPPWQIESLLQKKLLILLNYLNLGGGFTRTFFIK